MFKMSRRCLSCAHGATPLTARVLALLLADMLASHTADIDVDKEMVAAFCEFDTACTGKLDRETFKKVS